MKTAIQSGLVFILSFVLSAAVAQCKSVAKDGIAKLNPYTHNGQVNSVNIKNGKTAEFHLSFYKGLYYKLQISSEESLGKINFRVLDENKKEVYNSTTAKEAADFWSFYSNSSQDLTIEVTPTEDNKGCVAVLVGMQAPKRSNPIRNL